MELKENSQFLEKGKTEKEESRDKVKGLTVFTTVLFITGEMTGSGILALPAALKDAGWIGIFLIFTCGAVSAFSGTMSGRCWTILRENKPDETSHCKDPYPTIAFYAFGNMGRIITVFSVYFTSFEVCVVLLLLASENVQSLLLQVNVEMSFCYLLLIIGGFLIPLSWLKSPKDFWPIALGATITTTIACVLIFMQTILDIDIGQNNIKTHLQLVRDGEKERFERSFQTFFLAFGTILFCFGGMAAFPTIQADMIKPKKFTEAVLAAMSVILVLYVPIAIIGYKVYGDLVSTNILLSLSNGLFKTTALIFITVHLVFAYVIIQNPLCQVLEKPLHLSDKFGWARVLLRSVIGVVIIFTAESCPRFGHVLSLVGGSSVTVNTFIFPVIFYLKLCYTNGTTWKSAQMPKHEIPLHCIILVVGLFGGVSATYSAIRRISDPKAFVPPCYINISAASGTTEGH